MLPPVVQEIFADVSAISTTGDPFTVRCAGLLHFGGNFLGGLQVSFNNRRNFFPVFDGASYGVELGQKYWIQQTTGSTGAMQISVWPSDPREEASLIAVAALAGIRQPEPTRIPEEETGTSGVNVADTITIAGIANTIIYITGIYVFTEGAATASDVLIELEDGLGATPIWQGVIGQGAPRGTPAGGEGGPWPISIGSAANLQIAAGGALVVTRSSLVGYRVGA